MPSAARQLPADAGLQATAWPPSPQSHGGADTGSPQGAASPAEESKTEEEQEAMPAHSNKQPATSADGQADASAAASTEPALRPSSAKPVAPFSRLAEAGSKASHTGGLLAKLCRLTGHKAAESGPQQIPEQTRKPTMQAVKLAQSGLAVDAAEPPAAGTGKDASPAAQADQAAAASAAVAALAPLCPAGAASSAGMPVSGSAAGSETSNVDFSGSRACRGMPSMPSACTVRPTVSSTHASPPDVLRSGQLGQVESEVGSQAGCGASASQLQQAPHLEAAAAAAAAAGSHAVQEGGSQGRGQLPQQALQSSDNTQAGTPAGQQVLPGRLEPLVALDLETGPLPDLGGGAGDDPWGLAVELEDDGPAGKPWSVVRSIMCMHDALDMPADAQAGLDGTQQASRHA